MEPSTERTQTLGGKYSPRLRSPQYDHLINGHAKRMALLSAHVNPQTRQPHPLLPHDWRRELTVHVEEMLKRCSHTSRSFIEVENEHGVWGVEICSNCGQQVARECPHVESVWNADGTALICTNCGNDGT